MISSSLDVSSMERTYAAANSPVFLAVRIKRDPVAQALANQFDGNVLFGELRDLISGQLLSLRERALPFVFLGALGLQNDANLLGQSLTLKSRDEWFKPVAFVIYNGATPNNRAGVINGASVSSLVLKSPLITNKSNYDFEQVRAIK